MDINYIFSTIFATMSCTTVALNSTYPPADGNVVVCPEQTIEIPVERHVYLLSTDKKNVYVQKKNFRERYRRIAKSEWFKRTHSDMSIGEVMSVEE